MSAQRPMPPGHDYLWDRSGDDPEVARLEALLGGLAHDAPLAPLVPRQRRRALVVGLALGVAAVAAALVLLVVGRRSGSTAVAAGCDDRGGPGFRFAVTGGGARCGGADAVAGVLPVGAWLETARGSEAAVRVADLGELTLLGDSRLRAVATGPDQQRFELARGKLRARVSAPPRLFVVDTPGAAAVDLGCAYELEVDDAGQTRLWVTSGAVSLEGGGRSAYVPAGTEVATVGGGPGTPVRRAADGALRDAVNRWDGGDPTALAAVVADAGPCDTVTLWNLLGRTDGEARRAVFTRLDALAIRPEWVLEEDVLAGRPEALESWRRDLDASWSVGVSPTAVECVGPLPDRSPGRPDEPPPGTSPPPAPSSPQETPDEPSAPPAPLPPATWN